MVVSQSSASDTAQDLFSAPTQIEDTCLHAAEGSYDRNLQLHLLPKRHTGNEAMLLLRNADPQNRLSWLPGLARDAFPKVVHR
jgi:hypothetical protein